MSGEISEERVEINASRIIPTARHRNLCGAGLGGKGIMDLLELALKERLIKDLDEHVGDDTRTCGLQDLHSRSDWHRACDTTFVLNSFDEVRIG